jgi:hypothetical protein
MVKELWHSEEGSITVGGTDFTAEVKEISLSGGERDVEEVRCFGDGNVFAEEKPMTMIEATLTTRKKDVDLAQFWLGGSDASEPYAYSGEGVRTRPDIVYTWSDVSDVSGAQLKITMASTFGVSVEKSLDTDSHLTETLNFKCFGKDYKEEYTTDRVTSPIV